MAKRSEEELKRISMAYTAASEAAMQSAMELLDIAKEVEAVDIYAQDSPWDHVHRASIFAANLAQLVSLVKDKKKT